MAPAATAPSPVQSSRVHYIDGCRAIAMLGVLLWHAYLYAGLNNAAHAGPAWNWAWPLQAGQFGVNLFLLVSGFCLYWPFVKGSSRAEPTLGEYLYRRCRRILPPYYAALVIFFALGMVQALMHRQIFHREIDVHFMLGWLGSHALMIQNLSIKHVLALDAPLWSLALEFQLYILFPILVEAYRRWNKRTVLLAVLVFCTLYRSTIPAAAVADDPTSVYVLYYSVFGRCFEFALGMYVADLISRWPQQDKIPLKAADYLAGAAVIAGAFWRNDLFTDAAVGIVCAALLLAGSRASSIVGRCLSHRHLVTLGIFSYSVYLIHQPLLQAVGSALAKLHLAAPLQWLVVLGLVLPALLGVGYFYHLLFEKPFMSPPKTRPPGTTPIRLPLTQS